MHAGKDMTTGLLLEDPSPPADGAAEEAPAAGGDEGPMGHLRRRLTLLQAGAVQVLQQTLALLPCLTCPRVQSGGDWYHTCRTGHASSAGSNPHSRAMLRCWSVLAVPLQHLTLCTKYRVGHNMWHLGEGGG